MLDKNKFIEILEHQAQKDGVAYEFALSDFLDFLINVYDVGTFNGNFDGWIQTFKDRLTSKLDFGHLSLVWAINVKEAMEKGEWLDFFGELYEEMYLSRGKASKTGQFFTPGSVSDLMSAIIQPDKNQAPGAKENGNTVNDCAAGSGRLLLSHYMDVSKVDHWQCRKYYYVAQDSDPMACKMCALNMMIHGMQGKVICADTLANDTPSVVYYINEVRYPIPSPYYSIRKVSPKK